MNVIEAIQGIYWLVLQMVFCSLFLFLLLKASLIEFNHSHGDVGPTMQVQLEAIIVRAEDSGTI